MSAWPDPHTSLSVPFSPRHHFRFHLPHENLGPAFGGGTFGRNAEAFARFFGTPVFLTIQTTIVAIWITANALGWVGFDLYPFILLNLAFSLQAAYAAPLILLAQTRQADRDKAHADADARHREDLARSAEERLAYNTQQSEQLLQLLGQNTELTVMVKELAQRIESLTVQVHEKVLNAHNGAEGARP